MVVLGTVQLELIPEQDGDAAHPGEDAAGQAPVLAQGASIVGRGEGFQLFGGDFARGTTIAFLPHRKGRLVSELDGTI